MNLEKLIFYKCFSKLYHKPSKSQNRISGTKIQHFLMLFEGLGTNFMESNIKYKKFQSFCGKIHIICKNLWNCIIIPQKTKKLNNLPHFQLFCSIVKSEHVKFLQNGPTKFFLINNSSFLNMPNHPGIQWQSCFLTWLILIKWHAELLILDLYRLFYWWLKVGGGGGGWVVCVIIG